MRLGLGLHLGSLAPFGEGGVALPAGAVSDYNASGRDGETSIPNDSGAGSASVLGTTTISGDKIVFDGGDGSVQLQAIDTPSGDFSVAFKFDLVTPRADFDAVWSSESAVNNGLTLRDNGGSSRLEARIGGTGTTQSINLASGAGAGPWVVVMTLNTTDDEFVAYLDGAAAGTATLSAAGTVTHTTPHLGRRAFAANSLPTEGSVYRAVHWQRALTPAEVAAVSAALA